MVGLFKQPKRHLKKLIRDGEYTDAIVFGKNLEPEYSDDSDFMFIMGSIYLLWMTQKWHYLILKNHLN